MDSSTPTNSQNVLPDSEEFGALSQVACTSEDSVCNMTINSEIESQEYDSSLKKISNVEAWTILKEVNTQAEAAEKCIEKLSGSKISDLTGEDVEICGTLIGKIRVKFCKLRQAFKRRTIRLKNSSADKTFLALTDYEEFQVLCSSYVDGEETLREIDSEQESLTKATQTRPSLIHQETQTVLELLDKASQTRASVKNKETQTKGVTRPRKPLDQLRDKKQLHERGQEEIHALQKFCKLNSITMAQATGFFLKKNYYNENKKFAEIGQKLIEGSEIILTSEVPTLTALHLLERLKIGRGIYTNMRLVLLRLDIFCYIVLGVYNFVNVQFLSL